jgi:hypothetical protein
VNAATGQILNATDFLKQKMQSALAGQVYNPAIGWVPVKTAHVPVYNIDWGDVAPRASFAWNPSFENSLLKHVFGDQKSVIRGGFAMVYDRSNTVQAVEIPMLGVGFGQSINIALPSCTASGAPGPGCNASAGVAANPGLGSYRVGVDGSIPLPNIPTLSIPVVPGPQPFAEALSFQVDPNTKIGRSYNVDFSIQRELGAGMVLEAAYVGRFAKRLPQAVNFTQSPYMFVDPASGQSFAQAYDAIAAALRANQPASSIPVQPWFENQLPGLAAKNNTASATAFVVGRNTSSFISGNISSIFQNLGTYRRSLGLLPYNNDEAQMEFMRTYIGEASYNGLLVSLNKRTSHGLTFGANYTFSKSLDDDLQWQNNASFYPNSFHPGAEYGPSLFNRTHTFNANYLYDIPLGKGHRLSAGNWFDRVIGGWYTSGIVSVFSGPPVWVTESGQTWGDGAILGSNSAMIPLNGVPSGGLNRNSKGCNSIGTANGTGLSLFSSPCTAYQDFRPVLLSADTRDGRSHPIWGLPLKNMDARVGKNIELTEKVRMQFSADFFNLFNHPNFTTPSLNYYSNQTTFGVITGTLTPPNRTNSARWIELGLRVDF